MHILGAVKAKISNQIYYITDMYLSLGYFTFNVTPFRICIKFKSYSGTSSQTHVMCTRYSYDYLGLYERLGQFNGYYWAVSQAYKITKVNTISCVSLDPGTIVVYIHNCTTDLGPQPCYNIWPSPSTSIADYADLMGYFYGYGAIIIDSDAWSQICPFQGALNGWIIEIQKSKISPTPDPVYAWLEVEGVIPGSYTDLSNSSNWNGRFLSLDLTAISL